MGKVVIISALANIITVSVALIDTIYCNGRDLSMPSDLENIICSRRIKDLEMEKLRQDFQALENQKNRDFQERIKQMELEMKQIELDQQKELFMYEMKLKYKDSISLEIDFDSHESFSWHQDDSHIDLLHDDGFYHGHIDIINHI